MRRSEAARYARWSAAVALILAGITTAVYLKRGWTRHIERKQAPPAAPNDVTRQSNGINFKKVEQNHTIFQVQASKSTEFKGQDASLLEEVVVTIFGKAGDRHDILRTHSCQYDQKSGDISCGGDVRIDAMSAADAELVERSPSLAEARATRVETRGVTFNRSTGFARTDQRVTFAFPSGTGDGIGLEYNSDEGTLHLQHDVRLRLTQPTSTTAAKKTGISASVDPKAGQESALKVRRSISLATRASCISSAPPKPKLPPSASPPANSLSPRRRFPRANSRRLHHRNNRPRVVSTKPGEEINLESDNLTAHFVPDGSITKLDATGHVTGFRKNATDEDAMSGDNGSLTFWPRFSQPKELNVNGNVVLRTKEEKSGDTRTLQTTAFRMEFSGGKEHESSKPLTAETLAAGTMEWTDSATQGGTIVPARSQLQADKLAMTFTAATGKPKEVHANGNVRTERWLTGHPVQTATAATGTALMSADGGWSQMDLQGEVKLKEADRSGQADHAIFDRAAQTATLTGHAIARDATTQTQARRIIFHKTLATSSPTAASAPPTSPRRPAPSNSRPPPPTSPPISSRPTQNQAARFTPEKPASGRATPSSKQIPSNSCATRTSSTPQATSAPSSRKLHALRPPEEQPRRNQPIHHLSIRQPAQSTPLKSARKNRNSGTPPAKRSPTTTSKATPASKKMSSSNPPTKKCAAQSSTSISRKLRPDNASSANNSTPSTTAQAPAPAKSPAPSAPAASPSKKATAAPSPIAANTPPTPANSS